MTKIHKCPACHSAMPGEPGEAATSRYAKGIYVCPECGVKEAMEGFFWGATWYRWQPNIIKGNQAYKGE